MSVRIAHAYPGLLSLVFVCLLAGVVGDALISGSPAFYPRAVTFNGTHTAAVVTRVDGSNHTLIFCVRPSAGPAATWQELAVIAHDVSSSSLDVDLDNGFLFQLPDGTLLCAYRHHVRENGGLWNYSIQISSSSNAGATWSFLSTVITTHIGVWEPFFYIATLAPSRLRVLYSAELLDKQQDIVQRDSRDGGRTWSGETARLHKDGSRNGMAGVAELPDRSLVMVFEGFWTGAWNHFTVNSMRSFDGGATWGQPVIVHAPSVASGFDSGSPQIGACPDGSLAAVYMSNEPVSRPGQARAARVNWPDSARIWTIRGRPDPQNASQPVAWAGRAVVPTATEFGYWPGTYLDPTQRTVVAVYQDNAAAAWLSNTTLCP
eukprot:m.256745 g.256745  ORF g.256745 m.256745 type:complete len:375 (-) comp20375_c0_seq1:36-1160(-)